MSVSESLRSAPFVSARRSALRNARIVASKMSVGDWRDVGAGSGDGGSAPSSRGDELGGLASPTAFRKAERRSSADGTPPLEESPSSGRSGSPKFPANGLSTGSGWWVLESQMRCHIVTPDARTVRKRSSRVWRKNRACICPKSVLASPGRYGHRYAQGAQRLCLPNVPSRICRDIPLVSTGRRADLCTQCDRSSFVCAHRSSLCTFRAGSSQRMCSPQMRSGEGAVRPVSILNGCAPPQNRGPRRACNYVHRLGFIFQSVCGSRRRRD